MAFKQFTVGGELPVTIYKRRSSRHVRLTVASDGQVKVSIPAWAPYRSGLLFAESRLDWIKSQKRPESRLSDGQAVGKAHRLRLVPHSDATKVTSRIKRNEIIVNYPPDADQTEVQRIAKAAGVRALRKQAEALLPQRVRELADRHGFTYRSVAIKQMKSRWGSCDQHRNIVLNLYLMQLPWDCIDYVILHELTHTNILRHGPDFWGAMEKVLPDVKQVRKRLRDHQPVLRDSAELMA